MLTTVLFASLLAGQAGTVDWATLTITPTHCGCGAAGCVCPVGAACPCKTTNWACDDVCPCTKGKSNGKKTTSIAPGKHIGRTAVSGCDDCGAANVAVGGAAQYLATYNDYIARGFSPNYLSARIAWRQYQAALGYQQASLRNAPLARPAKAYQRGRAVVPAPSRPAYGYTPVPTRVYQPRTYRVAWPTQTPAMFARSCPT